MKREIINHGHEEARIYAKNYKASFNIFRTLLSVFGVLISGQPQTAQNFRRRK